MTDSSDTIPQVPTASEALKAFRKKFNLRLEDLADMLDTSKQRLSQIENGGTLPFERIRDWATSGQYPTSVKELAYQLWIAHLYQEIQQTTARVSDLQQLVAAD